MADDHETAGIHRDILDPLRLGSCPSCGAAKPGARCAYCGYPFNPEGDGGPTMAAVTDSKPIRPLWHRAGAITGILWAVALIVTFLITGSVTGSPRLPDWFVVFSGFVVLGLVGRRFGLQGPSAWLLAGALAAIVAMVIVLLFVFFWTLSGYPGMPDDWRPPPPASPYASPG